MALAMFDLDNTLIAGDSDHAWLEFLFERDLYPRSHNSVDGHPSSPARNATEAHLINQSEYFYRCYQQGRLDTDQWFRFALLPYSHYPKAQLEEWREEYVRTKIMPMVLSKATALIESHRTNSDQLLIVSATNEFLVSAVANLYGIDDYLATRLESNNGKYTGAISGIPCLREGKVTYVSEWCKQRKLSIDTAYFYSDSHNDIPLLQCVRHPIAVDPDDHLHDYARSRNWQVMSLRN